MSGSSYLYRRPSGVYFVRLCVPSRLKQAVGKGELHRSTGCRDLRLAKIVAAELVAHWHRSIEALQHMDINKLLAGSVKLLGDGDVSLVEAAVECGTTPADLAQRLVGRRFGLFVHADEWLGWLTEDIFSALDHCHDQVTGELEVVIDGSRLGGTERLTKYSGLVSLRFPDEVSGVLRGAEDSAQVCQFLFWPSVSRALVCDLPGQTISINDILVRRTDVSSITRQLLAELPAVKHLPGSEASPEAAVVSEAFSGLCRRYFERNSDLWKKADHRRRKEDHTRIFIELSGDLPVSAIDRKVMRAFADHIKNIPSQRHKFAQKLGLNSPTYRDLIELKQTHGQPGLSEGEQRKVLETISQIFTWAVAEQDMPSNPATLLGTEVVRKAGKRKKKAHEQRQRLAPEDLAMVFSAPWFRDGVGHRTAQGRFYHYRPYHYWLPILALYCGGRLNELSQLYLSDVVIHEGIHCLDFNLSGEDKLDIDEGDLADATDKSLKNISSARVVPLPQRIIDLGLIAYVEKLKALGHVRVFPELLFDKEKGYGKYAGKWFNDSFMGKQLGIPRNGQKTFHSMRHNFATALGALHADPNQKSDLMGHKRKGSTTEVRYDKGIFGSLKVLIDRIEHPHPPIQGFNVELGVEALNDALSLKVSRVAKGKRAIE